jgi:YidC/Oxa1 family membrane protein insertase
MDKNTWIGFLLIAAIIVGFTMLNRPSKEELAERQHQQDSIALAQQVMAEAQRISDSITAALETEAPASVEVKERMILRSLQLV